MFLIYKYINYVKYGSNVLLHTYVGLTVTTKPVQHCPLCVNTLLCCLDLQFVNPTLV